MSVVPATDTRAPDRTTLSRVPGAVLLESALDRYDCFLFRAAAALVFGAGSALSAPAPAAGLVRTEA